MKHIKNFVLITEENIKKMGYDGLKFKSDKSYEGNFNYWNYYNYNKNHMPAALNELYVNPLELPQY